MDYLIDEAGTKFDQIAAGFLRHVRGYEDMCRNRIADDGHRWRKYGQKSIKNSPNPRCDLNHFQISVVLSLDLEKHVDKDCKLPYPFIQQNPRSEYQKLDSVECGLTISSDQITC